MSTEYQILDNRPIDKWKVTELKEELKRRKLTTRGLKKDLVKRLDDALRIERENTANEADDNGINHDSQPMVEEGLEKETPTIAENVKDTVDHGGNGTEIITVTQTVVTEVPLIEQHLQSSKQEENVNSNIQIDTEGPKLENKDDHVDDMHDSSALNKQVPEINPISGSQVKSDSTNEKIEVNDNTIDDNVKLSLDVVKPEIDEHSVKNKASVDERDDKNDSGEMGYSEKLNLDRSSGDESMEEDSVETKQNESKCSTDEIGDNSVKNDTVVIKEESRVAVVGDGSSTDKKDVFVEKRKLHDEEAIGNNEPPKRHKLDSDDLQVPEQQATNLTLTNTPKDTMQLAALKSNYSTSDSTDSEDSPKERAVPPSKKPPTTSLRVDHFLRPFTLKAVQELLGKTGTITSFWMDHIKTHCYVTYSSVEEAIETRNAIYNLQWPPNGGRQLVAEFVDPREVNIHLETSWFTAAQHVPENKLSPPSALPSPSPSSNSNPPPVENQLPLPPLPPSEEPDSPMPTIDDIFWKTKATLKIYYLPLSKEQVAAKQARRDKKTKQW